jgi:hypothetical protein
MKVMITSTYYGDSPTLNEKYSCLDSYNYGLETVLRESTVGWITDEYKRRIRQVKNVEKERPYIMLDSLESLKKLMKDLDENLAVFEDYDFPDRLLIEIYDTYRE